jgi:hypothetical protein
LKKLAQVSFYLIYNTRVLKIITELVVLSSSRKAQDDTTELGEDLLAITTVFVARHNGLRAAENKRRRREEEREGRIEKNEKETKIEFKRRREEDNSTMEGNEEQEEIIKDTSSESD